LLILLLFLHFSSATIFAFFGQHHGSCKYTPSILKIQVILKDDSVVHNSSRVVLHALTAFWTKLPLILHLSSLNPEENLKPRLLACRRTNASAPSENHSVKSRKRPTHAQHHAKFRHRAKKKTTNKGLKLGPLTLSFIVLTSLAGSACCMGETRKSYLIRANRKMCPNLSLLGILNHAQNDLNFEYEGSTWFDRC
jgi:hypothetical protein